jgi:hypothetical protein
MQNSPFANNKATSSGDGRKAIEGPDDRAGWVADYFFADFMRRSYFSAPTHSLAKAHHSTQEVPSVRAFRWPHFLQTASGSSDQISIFSPHFWHRISSGLGDRISALPGQPSLNNPMIQLYLVPGKIL